MTETTNGWIKIGDNIEWRKDDGSFLTCLGKKEPGHRFARDKQFTLAFVKDAGVDLADAHPMFESINDWGYVGVFPEIWIEDDGELWVEPFSVVREWWGIDESIEFQISKSVRIKDIDDEEEKQKVIQETIDALNIGVEEPVYDEVAPHQTHKLSDAEIEAFKVKDELLSVGKRYIQFESGFYWDDVNHEGNIFVSQKMVAKHKLDDEIVELIDDWFDDRNWDQDDREDYKHYSHVICISHRDGYSRDEDDADAYLNYDTPHGELQSEEFVAWDIGFPFELFSEPEEDVRIWNWCDG